WPSGSARRGARCCLRPAARRPGPRRYPWRLPTTPAPCSCPRLACWPGPLLRLPRWPPARHPRARCLLRIQKGYGILPRAPERAVTGSRAGAGEGRRPPAEAGPRSAHDAIVSAVPATARGTVGVVTSLGRLIRLSVLELPALPPSAHSPGLAGGAPIGEFIGTEPGETVVAIVAADANGTSTGGAGLAL